MKIWHANRKHFSTPYILIHTPHLVTTFSLSLISSSLYLSRKFSHFSIEFKEFVNSLSSSLSWLNLSPLYTLEISFTLNHNSVDQVWRSKELATKCEVGDCNISFFWSPNRIVIKWNSLLCDKLEKRLW